MSADIARLLDDLARLEYETENALESLPDMSLHDALREQLAVVDARLDAARAPMAKQIATLRTQIADAVLAEGASVKGSVYQAVYQKPRVTWNSMQLSGYSAAHPEILAFRAIGEPSVSIRRCAPPKVTPAADAAPQEATEAA